MAEKSDKPEKKPVGKTIIDVKHPGDSAATPTSKPVIVTNRPILQDPMVNESNTETDQPPAENPGKKPKLQPLTAPELAETPTEERDPNAAVEAKTETIERKPAVVGEKVITPIDPSKAKEKTAETDKAPAEEAAQDEELDSKKPAGEPDETTEAKEEADASAGKKAAAAQAPEDVDAEAKAEAEYDATIEKLIDSHEHFLPINSVEKRRAKHVIVLGVLLSLVLAAAWVDIALDAGIIHLSSVKPVTHFFSN
jgi:hypothetical protein